MSLTPEQQENARIIQEVGRELGASDRDILIALMTAAQESNLKNINYGDRDSIGLFQQRRPWGTDEQRMDPRESARMFFEGGHTGQPGLFSKKNRDQMSLTQAAQAVQVSAFPDAYAKWESMAREFMGSAASKIPASTGGGGSSMTPKPQDTLNWKDLAEEYGWNAAYIKQSGLMNIFKEAATKGWDPEEFKARLKTTDWYRNHAESWQNAMRLQAEHPAEWKAQVEAQTQKILDAAGQVGAQISVKQARSIASNAFLGGMNDSQIQNVLGQYVHETKNSPHFGGQAGGIEMQVREFFSDNGVKMSQQGISDWVRKISVGDKSVEDAQAYARTQAELNFPTYAAQIKAGMSVKDIAQTYMQSMADTLELNPDSIKLDDKMIRQALTYKNKDGKPEALSQTDFEIMARQDPRWRKTQNAQDHVFAVASQVLKDFGFQA